jgi:hypothetical protein
MVGVACLACLVALVLTWVVALTLDQQVGHAAGPLT